MLNITSGKISRAQKIVIYGPEGVGKSTIAAQFPDPVINDTEDGTAHMNVRRLPKPLDWNDEVDLIEEVARSPGICETLVIDTIDWAEQLCIKYVCTKYKKSGIEEFGYGKGYIYLAEEFSRLLTACDKVIAAGMNVVITAHAKMRKFEQPDEMGAFDRWETKLTKQVAPLLKEWSDMLLFCNYKTYVVTQDDGKCKAQGGKRVIYTTHHPCWDAKNRHQLPDEMEMSFDSLKHLFAPKTTAEDPETENLHQKVFQMISDSGITEDQLRNLVAAKGHYSAEVAIADYPDIFITRWIVPNWEKIVSTIKNS